MPVSDKTKPRAKAQPKKQTPPPRNVTVKDCMVWPTKETPTAKNQIKPKNKGKETPGVRFAQTRDMETKEKVAAAVERVAPPPQDDGTAIEALRGWPKRAGQEEDQGPEFSCQPQENTVAVEKKTESQKAGPTKGKKGENQGSKKKKEKENDPWIGDLISHKFHKDLEEKLKAEKEKADRQQQKKAFKDKESKEMTKRNVNIKANKAAQLRSIALADKVELKPSELWQMQKFKDVKPHLDTKGKNITHLPRDEAVKQPGSGSKPAGNADGNGASGGDSEFISGVDPEVAETYQRDQDDYYVDDSENELYYDPSHRDDYDNPRDHGNNYDATFNNMAIFAL